MPIKSPLNAYSIVLNTINGVQGIGTKRKIIVEIILIAKKYNMHFLKILRSLFANIFSNKNILISFRFSKINKHHNLKYLYANYT